MIFYCKLFHFLFISLIFFGGGGGQQLYVRVNKQKIKMKVEQLAEIIGDGLLTSKYYD